MAYVGDYAACTIAAGRAARRDPAAPILRVMVKALAHRLTRAGSWTW